MVVTPESPFAQLTLLFALAQFVPLVWFRKSLDPPALGPVRI